MIFIKMLDLKYDACILNTTRLLKSEKKSHATTLPLGYAFWQLFLNILTKVL